MAEDLDALKAAHADAKRRHDEHVEKIKALKETHGSHLTDEIGHQLKSLEDALEKAIEELGEIELKIGGQGWPAT